MSDVEGERPSLRFSGEVSEEGCLRGKWITQARVRGAVRPSNRPGSSAPGVLFDGWAELEERDLDGTACAQRPDGIGSWCWVMRILNRLGSGLLLPMSA